MLPIAAAIRPATVAIGGRRVVVVVVQLEEGEELLEHLLRLRSYVWVTCASGGCRRLGRGRGR